MEIENTVEETIVPETPVVETPAGETPVTETQTPEIATPDTVATAESAPPAEIAVAEISAAEAVVTPPADALDTKAIIEALLFVTSDPLSLDKMQEILGQKSDGTKLEKKELRDLLLELQADYQNRRSALQLVEIANGWQICTRGEFSSWLEKLAKNKEVYKLSNSALETLSIIAYKQPITRAELEHIRGVDSGGVIHNLLEKRLVRITGRKDALGHPILYGTTAEFLQYFGLASIADLPLIEDLNKG